MKTYQIETRTLVERPTAVADTTPGTYPAGPPFARYRKLGDEAFEVEAGFPVASPVKAMGEVRPSLPGGTAAATEHAGPHDEMEPGYEALADWVKSRGYELAGDAWEIYFNDPSAELDQACWRTEIVQPYQST